MEEWQGHVLSKNEIQLTENDNSKYLNEAQEKIIRGSGWWQKLWKGIVSFFQKIVAPIATVLLFIPGLQPIGAIALWINVMIQTVSFVVRTGTLMDIVWSVGMCALPGIVNAVAGAVGSIVNAIFPNLSGAFSTALTIFEPMVKMAK